MFVQVAGRLPRLSPRVEQFCFGSNEDALSHWERVAEGWVRVCSAFLRSQTRINWMEGEEIFFVQDYSEVIPVQSLKIKRPSPSGRGWPTVG